MPTTRMRARSLVSALLLLGAAELASGCAGSDGRAEDGEPASVEVVDVAPERPRIVATTDGEIDDRCSMVRFLLHANEWDIESIVYSSSRYHWVGHDWAGTDWVQEQIGLYAQVLPSLRRHDPAYPSAESLRERVYVGNIDAEGAMEADTPGSDRIVEVLLDDEPGPVYLQAWGGTNTIARALWKIEHQHPEAVERVARKAVVYVILDQDDTLREYIEPHWPDLTVLVSHDQFRAIDYNWRENQPDHVRAYFDEDWMREHILEGHGPLASAYPTDEFHSEGDTPAFLHSVRTGLGALAHPGHGGWGGRFEREDEDGNVWRGARDDGNLFKPIWRWAKDFQNEWAARADWSVRAPEEANHPPRPVVQGVAGRGILRIRAVAGDTVSLDGSESSDPDGDGLAWEWKQYIQAGTCGEPLEIAGADGPVAEVTLPEDAGDCEAHVILTLSDDGSPKLVRYRRIILEVAHANPLRRLL